jgi:hypothetical protein
MQWATGSEYFWLPFLSSARTIKQATSGFSKIGVIRY